MKAKSIKGKTVEEIRNRLDNCMEDGFKPTLAVVFLSISQDRNAITKLLDEVGISIFGTTTHGEFINDELKKKSTVIILLDIKKEYFTILFDEFENENYSQTTELFAKESLKHFKMPAFVISGSNLNTDAEAMIAGIENILGKEVNIFGGMAGDDYEFNKQYVFTNNRSSSNGVVALVLDENKILIKGRATHGWKAVGTPKTVTKSEGKHVYAVDDISVLELTKKYGGLDELVKENTDSEQQATMIATNFPLQLQRKKGDPVMRPGLIIDWKDGSFYCGGKVPQGSKVKFSLPPDLDVMEKVVDGLKDLRDTEMPEADAVLVFSCAGRIISLGPLMGQEIEGINNIWNAPMAGFFSSGEIARATYGNNDLHNLTTCCVALKEK